MYLEGGINRNLVNAKRQQSISYQRTNIIGTNIGYNKVLTDLLPQSIQTATNNTRNITTSIAGPAGSTPGPLGVAGSNSIGLAQPPVIGNRRNAGF